MTSDNLRSRSPVIVLRPDELRAVAQGAYFAGVLSMFLECWRERSTNIRRVTAVVPLGVSA